jgi:ribonuclease T2
MAVQWSNGYCLANSCGKKADHVNKNGMTIHGLWPSLKSGKMLNPCTTGVTITDDGSELFTKMRQYWPSFAKSNEEFWEHEYNKHGYCMVEEYGWDDYEEYFNFVIDLHLKTYEKLIINAFPNSSDTTTTVSYDTMIQKIQKVIPNAIFKMNCESKYIYEFYFYLEKNFAPSTSSKFSNTCSSGKLVFK